MLPEKESEPMEFLRQDRVRCKIAVDNKCLQNKVQNFKYYDSEIFSEYLEDIQKQQAKFFHVLEIPNNACKPNLVQKCSRTKVYNALALPSLLYGSEIWTLIRQDNKKKQLELFERNCFKRKPRTLLFWPQKERRNFWRDERRTSWRETKKIHIKLVTTCN